MYSIKQDDQNYGVSTYHKGRMGLKQIMMTNDEAVSACCHGWLQTP